MNIIVKISDGLGNQMFQYAFARFLEEQKKRKVLLDISHYKTNKDRKFELDLFNTKYHIATEHKLPLSKYKKNKEKLFKTVFKENSVLYDAISGIFEYFIDDIVYKAVVPGYINQSDAHKDRFFDSKKYYEGYRQSEKYFPGMRDILLKEFTLKKTLDKRNQELLDKIHTSNSVSFHVRRGDYAKISVVRNPLLFPCKITYYNEAIRTIQQKIKDPVFFVFSDDMDRVKKNIKFTNEVYYIDWNTGENSYKDMWIMSQCKHNIISNSTFSWRAARLNQYKKKIIIGPQKWFLLNSMNKEILHPEWIKL